ncbi:elongation of very long chain fatty acids protein-like isoform X1 [Diabrotica virgifera virgifera]|uniref:Elongation of very long chain fatty acids protein n=1 Tax=Diabrotica virgifera virgifera TaxID=50390 RepID=A0A6P7GUW3_DIAVI|nr:elongation of very long chain fatty acids protein-like isoform X1 [Diabrotica virgifera virgifera]
MAIITDVVNDFTRIIDRRHEDYIVSSPDFFWSFLLFYVFSIKVLGPKLMKNRQPYNIQNIIIGYNVIQIVMNLYLVYRCIYMYVTNRNWICMDSKDKDYFADTSKYYYYLKLFDFVETVFFILRKSYRQASFLHLYHHGLIFFGAFLNFRYDLAEASFIVGLLNSATHVLMYIYYLLTAMDSEWRTNVTLKKSLTLIQIVQLNLLWVYTGLLQVIPDCQTIPKYVQLVWMAQNLFMVNLFLRFYFKSYVNKKVSVSTRE